MRHGFEFAAAYRLAALPFGVTPRTAYVDLGPDALVVRFGLWRLETPVDNIASARLTGGFTFLKTAGPPHLSFSDRGVTFATNPQAAACLTFQRPVRVLDPTGRLTHPGATLTVTDPAALLADVRRVVPTADVSSAPGAP